jgi:hypothetical protein
MKGMKAFLRRNTQPARDSRQGQQLRDGLEAREAADLQKTNDLRKSDFRERARIDPRRSVKTFDRSESFTRIVAIHTILSGTTS